MEQEQIRQQLTKAFGLAPMTVAVLVGIEEDGLNPRLGEVFVEVLQSDRYQTHFTQGFEMAGIDNNDMMGLMQGGIEAVTASLDIAAQAIRQLTNNPEQSLYIKMRLFEFGEDMALKLDNRQPGEGEQLSELYQAKLHFLSVRLNMQEDMQLLA